MKKVLVVFLVLCVTFALFASGVAELEEEKKQTEGLTFEKQKLKFSYFGTQDSTSGLGVQLFKKLVEEKTEGQVTVECYYNGTLFGQSMEFEALMKGNADFIVTSMNYAMEYIPEIKTTFCPYLWKSVDHWNAFWDTDEGQMLMKRCQDELGVRYLSFHTGGQRNICLNADIKVSSREALKKIKLRSAPAENMLIMTESLGGNPIPIAFSDAYLSIQTGLVDGFEANLKSAIANGLDEVTKSVTLTEHYISLDGIVVSEKKWETWSPELQQIIKESALESSAYVSDLSIEADVASAKALEDNGIKVYRLTDVERSGYREQVVDYFINSDFAKDYDKKLFDVMKRVGDNY